MERMFPDLFARMCMPHEWENTNNLWDIVLLALSVILHKHQKVDIGGYGSNNSYTRDDATLRIADEQARSGLETAANIPAVRDMLLRYRVGRQMTKLADDTFFISADASRSTHRTMTTFLTISYPFDGL